MAQSLIDDPVVRASVDRRPRLTEARLHQLELAYRQAWIGQPLSLDALKLIAELRLARKALATLGTRANSVLSMRGWPGRGEGSDDLLNLLDTVAEGLGIAEEERAPAPAAAQGGT